MILEHFVKCWERRFGPFPSTYLVFDSETTGTRVGTDLIGEIGFCMVSDGKITDNFSVLINWFDGTADTEWLRGRLEDTRRQVEFDRDGRPTGRHYQLSEEGMRRGVPAHEAMQICAEVFTAARVDNLPLVAHNGIAFDVPMLQYHFQRWLSCSWDPGENGIIDTGIIVKASQGNMIPESHDSIRSYCSRVAAQRWRGVYWALDRYCVPKWNLAEKHNLDMSRAHGAAFDTYLAHLVFEEIRSLAAPPVSV